ncbi:MAG: GerW family sporulation protein, partial [Lachnospiraceae bacterium]
NVKNQDTVTKILDMVPDLLDRFGKKKEDENQIPDKDAVEAAFPEEK